MIQQPKAPDKPLLPYMRYSRKMWEELKAEGKRVWEVGKVIGQKWREMSDEEKQPYFEEYEQEKAVYNEQLKAYRNSPAYKRWLDAKQQGTCVEDRVISRALYLTFLYFFLSSRFSIFSFMHHTPTFSLPSSLPPSLPSFLPPSLPPLPSFPPLFPSPLPLPSLHSTAEQAAREAASLGPQHSEYGPPPPSVIAPPRQTPAEARIQMMQHEDEEGEAGVGGREGGRRKGREDVG